MLTVNYLWSCFISYLLSFLVSVAPWLSYIFINPFCLQQLSGALHGMKFMKLCDVTFGCGTRLNFFSCPMYSSDMCVEFYD